MKMKRIFRQIKRTISSETTRLWRTRLQQKKKRSNLETKLTPTNKAKMMTSWDKMTIRVNKNNNTTNHKKKKITNWKNKNKMSNKEKMKSNNNKKKNQIINKERMNRKRRKMTKLSNRKNRSNKTKTNNYSSSCLLI